jgi:multiple sugar transport system substrate-binding protein
MKRGFIPVVVLCVLALSMGGCGKKKLRVAHIYQPLAGPDHRQNFQWLNRVVGQFEKRHPDRPVRLEYIAWDKIDAKSLADYRAGVSHDVLMTSPQFMPQHFVEGDLLDLTPFLLKWPKERVEDISWSASWRKSERNGVRLGIPTGVHARVVIFRRDMFEEAGLDPKDPPETLNELIEAAKVLTRDTDYDGKTDVWGLAMYMGPNRATIELYFAPLLWHFGGELYDEEAHEAVFASEAGVKAAQFLDDCIHVHKITPPWACSGTYDDVILQPFMEGRVAMAWGWGSYWSKVLEAKGWIKGLVPPTPEGKEVKVGIFLTPTKTGAQFANSWTISIHKLSRHPREAFSFIETVLEPHNLETYPDAGLPALKSIWAKKEYQNHWYEVWRKAAEAGRPMPNTPHYYDLADTVSNALQEIILKRADPARTLKRYQDEFNRKYARP